MPRYSANELVTDSSSSILSLRSTSPNRPPCCFCSLSTSQSCRCVRLFLLTSHSPKGSRRPLSTVFGVSSIIIHTGPTQKSDRSHYHIAPDFYFLADYFDWNNSSIFLPRKNSAHRTATGTTGENTKPRPGLMATDNSHPWVFAVWFAIANLNPLQPNPLSPPSSYRQNGSHFFPLLRSDILYHNNPQNQSKYLYHRYYSLSLSRYPHIPSTSDKL